MAQYLIVEHKECMEIYEAGLIIDSLYTVERNVRIQNAKVGFGSCFPMGSIVVNYPLTVKDFDVPKPDQANGFGWHFGPSLTDVCKWLYNQQLPEYPELAGYVQEGETKLEQVLNEANRKGWRFIIETVWDSGYYLYLLKPFVKHSCIEEYVLDQPDANELARWMEMLMERSFRHSNK
jgi:hypothetical protein